MNIEKIFMNAAMDKRMLQQISTSLVLSVLPAIPQLNLFLAQLQCLVILLPESNGIRIDSHLNRTPKHLPK